MNTYPSPCDKCEKENPDLCASYRTCEAWLTWFRWHWKQFNLYAKKHGIEPTTPPKTEKGNENND